MKIFRSLIIASLLALALVAMAGVSTASAAKFVSESEEVGLSSTSGSQQLQFQTGPTFECSAPVLSGVAQGKQVLEGYAHGSLATPEAATPSCVSSTMSWNGCELTLHAPAGGASQGTVDIGPANCGPIAFKYGSSCEWAIPAQAGIAATYQNTGSGTGRKVNVSISTKSLQYTTVVSNGCGPKGTFSSGTWNASFALQGATVPGGQPVGLWVAKLPVGVYAAGEAIQAESYPATLVGEISKEHKFQMNGEQSAYLSCQSGSLSSSLGGSSSALDVSATYESCEPWFDQSVAVKMNSCRYVLEIAAANSGTAKVACSTEGDGIELQVGTSYCTWKLPAQTLGTATYSTTGSLNGRKVVAEVSGSGLTYVRIHKGGLLCFPGSSTGTFSGGFTFGGVE